MVYSFIRISQSPQLRSSPKKQGKTCGHRPLSPTRTEGLVPLGDILRHCCYYLSAVRPSAPYLPPCLEETRAPLASVCHINPLQNIPSTLVTISHIPHGTVHVILWYWRVVGFMGGWEGHKPHVREKNNECKCFVGNPPAKKWLGRLRAILKRKWQQ